MAVLLLLSVLAFASTALAENVTLGVVYADWPQGKEPEFSMQLVVDTDTEKKCRGRTCTVVVEACTAGSADGKFQELIDDNIPEVCKKYVNKNNQKRSMIMENDLVESTCVKGEENIKTLVETFKFITLKGVQGNSRYEIEVYEIIDGERSSSRKYPIVSARYEGESTRRQKKGFKETKLTNKKRVLLNLLKKLLED